MNEEERNPILFDHHVLITKVMNPHPLLQSIHPSTHALLPSSPPLDDFSQLSFPHGQEQPIPDIAQPRLDHPPAVRLPIHPAHPHRRPLGPDLGDLGQALGARQDGDGEDPPGAGFAEGFDCCDEGAAGGDDGVEDYGEVGGGGGRWRGGGGGGG